MADLAEISVKLAPALRSGRYSGVLWDDAGGRLPGLFFHELAALVAYDNGKPIPFGAGALAGKTEHGNLLGAATEHGVAHAVQALSQDLGPSVLLVTEAMDEGKALRKLTGALQARRKTYDVLVSTWAMSEPEIRRYRRSIVGPGVNYYSVDYDPARRFRNQEPWEEPHLVAARGMDINLSGPKARRDALAPYESDDPPHDLSRDEYQEYLLSLPPRFHRSEQAFLAEEARRQLSVIARAVHRSGFRDAESDPRLIAEAATNRLTTHVRRAGQKDSHRANRGL